MKKTTLAIALLGCLASVSNAQAQDFRGRDHGSFFDIERARFSEFMARHDLFAAFRHEEAAQTAQAAAAQDLAAAHDAASNGDFHEARHDFRDAQREEHDAARQERDARRDFRDAREERHDARHDFREARFDEHDRDHGHFHEPSPPHHHRGGSPD